VNRSQTYGKRGATKLLPQRPRLRLEPLDVCADPVQLLIDRLVATVDMVDAVDLGDSLGGKSGQHKCGRSLEVTLFTQMNDLAQNQFYIRPINTINFSKVDLTKLTGVKEFKKVSLDQVAQLNGAEATGLFLN